MSWWLNYLGLNINFLLGYLATWESNFKTVRFKVGFLALSTALTKTVLASFAFQLEESEKSRLQLRETLREVESSRSPQQEVETLEASLREREKELARSKAAEKERVGPLTTEPRD